MARDEGADLVDDIPDVGGRNGAVPRTRRTKKAYVTEAEVCQAVSGGCNLIASFGREWWSKSEKEVLPFAAPLTAYVNELPPHIGKILGDMMRPYALVMGAIVVFGPSIAVEIELAKRNRGVQTTRSEYRNSRNNSAASAGTANTDAGFAGNAAYGIADPGID